MRDFFFLHFLVRFKSTFLGISIQLRLGHGTYVPDWVRDPDVLVNTSDDSDENSDVLME